MKKLSFLIGVFLISFARGYSQPAKVDNTDTAKSYYSDGLDKAYKEDYIGAIADFTKAIELNPKYSAAFEYRGMSKYMLNDSKDAIIDYNRAIELNPKYAEAYRNRGLAKITLKQKESGCLDFKKAKELGDQYADLQILKYCK
jgi:tetratricopeptide (TPR) repeat protein